MKPEEAITELEGLKDSLDGMPPETGVNETYVALNMAIEALKEVQQYQLIKNATIGEIAEVLKEFSDIGTVEECRAAVEKQKPKKPLGGMDINSNEYKICRECSAIVQDGEWRAEYCPDCGNRVDWREGE